MMLLPIVTICLSVKPDTVVIRPGGKGRISMPFSAFPRTPEAKISRILFNRKDSGLRIPSDWSVDRVGYDSKGHLAGNFVETVSGAYTFTNTFAFTTKNGKLEILPPPKRFRQSVLQHISPKGDLAGIWGYGIIPGQLDRPYENVSHGFCIRGSRTFDLGPANRVRFLPYGVIEGTAIRDKDNGRYMGVMIVGQSEVERFRWENGKRHVVSTR